MLVRVLIWVIVGLTAANMLLGLIIALRRAKIARLQQAAEDEYSTGTEDIERPCKPRRTPAPGQRRQR